MDQAIIKSPAAPSPSPPAAKPGRVAAAISSLVSVGVTGIVLAGLTGLLYWGHSTGWKLPAFSKLTGAVETEKDDWCEKHRVPQSICIECNPEKAPAAASFGWCTVHGVSNCPLEHPEVAELATPHAVTTADRDRALSALGFTDRVANNATCKLYEKRIQLASADVAKKCGIEVDTVKTGPIEECLDVHGDLMYDQTRLAHLSSRVHGSIWTVRKKVGDVVRKGEVLALVESTEVGKAKGEFLQAYAQAELRTKNWDALRSGVGTGSIPERDMREADTAAQEARIRLKSAQQALANLALPVSLDELRGLSQAALERRIQFLDLPADLTQTMDPSATPANLLPIITPQDGTVVMTQSVAGEMVDPTKVLFTVASLDPLWLMLDVHFEDVQYLHPGQSVHFRPDGSKVEPIGKIAWISPEADERTRTVKVRVHMDNADRSLVVRAFGCGRVVLREEKNAIMIPSAAVQWEGCCNVVFVQDKASNQPGALQIYHVRQVRLGVREGDKTEVIAGLLPGETIVTKGSGVMKSELLKHKIGAPD
jgi:membrane fusion protein, heavy metal efflux system